MSEDREAMAMVGLVAARKGVACAIARGKCRRVLYGEAVSAAVLRLASGLAKNYDPTRQEWKHWAWCQGYWAAKEVFRSHLRRMRQKPQRAVPIYNHDCPTEETEPEIDEIDAFDGLLPEGLSPLDRRIVRLHFEGFDYQEIASVVGCHRHTVRTHFLTAMALIRTHHQQKVTT